MPRCALRERARPTKITSETVSADARFASIIARLPHRADQFEYKVEAVGAIRKVLERELGPDFYLAGGPAFDEQFFHSSEADSARTIALMTALLVVVLWLLTRSVWGVILPLATVMTATVWTFARVLVGAHANTYDDPAAAAAGVGVARLNHVLVDYQTAAARAAQARRAPRSDRE